MEEHIENFVGEVIKMGNSLGITIPVRQVKFSGIKEGDTLKVYYKVVKVVPAEETKE